MPATITQSPIDVERKDPGSGGRPPVPRRPTGGGGGDENWGRGQPLRGPRELLTRCRMGLGFALAGDLTFFVSLILAFYAQQHTRKPSTNTCSGIAEKSRSNSKAANLTRFGFMTVNLEKFYGRKRD